MKNGDPITFSIWKNNAWLEFKSSLVLPKQQKVDIAVIPLPEPIAPAHSVKTNQGLTLGAETFFFGFPFGLKQNAVGQNKGFPFALVKKAIISGTFGAKGTIGIFLDGHNNVGFSGGPIGYYDSRLKQIVILGVISGYVNNNSEITTPFGKFPFKENSGLILGYGIGHAIRLISPVQSSSWAAPLLHPDGLQLNQNAPSVP